MADILAMIDADVAQAIQVTATNRASMNELIEFSCRVLKKKWRLGGSQIMRPHGQRSTTCDQRSEKASRMWKHGVENSLSNERPLASTTGDCDNDRFLERLIPSETVEQAGGGAA